jgi:uncharacterized membrane protein YhaH (DUF805 family)
MNWYIKVLTQYSVFSGRARRKEYWMFSLFNIIFALVALIIDNILGFTIDNSPFGIFYFSYSLIVFIPGLAVLVRRLHDVGKSGWMILISLIPIIGAIWLLVLLVQDSESGTNQYGEPQKKADNNTEASYDAVFSDNIVLLVVIYMFVSNLFYTIVPKVFDNYFLLEWFKPVNFMIGLVWAIVPLTLAFTIKKDSKKVALLVLGALYFGYVTYESINKLTL